MNTIKIVMVYGYDFLQRLNSELLSVFDLFFPIFFKIKARLQPFTILFFQRDLCLFY